MGKSKSTAKFKKKRRYRLVWDVCCTVGNESGIGEPIEYIARTNCRESGSGAGRFPKSNDEAAAELDYCRPGEFLYVSFLGRAECLECARADWPFRRI